MLKTQKKPPRVCKMLYLNLGRPKVSRLFYELEFVLDLVQFFHLRFELKFALVIMRFALEISNGNLF